MMSWPQTKMKTTVKAKDIDKDEEAEVESVGDEMDEDNSELGQD